MGSGKAIQHRADMAKVTFAHPVLLLAGDELSHDIGHKRMPHDVAKMAGVVCRHGSQRFRARDFA